MAKMHPIPMVGLANAHRHWENREIHELVFPDDGYVSTKSDGVDQIIPYSEPGEMASTIWFEVIYENKSRVRFNGSYVSSVGFIEIDHDS